MKNRFGKTSFLALSAMALVGLTTYSSWAYIVKKGDTLSQLTAHALHGRIYGHNGNLSKVLAANSDIQNANVIHVGQDIDLSLETLAKFGYEAPGSEARDVASTDATAPQATPASPEAPKAQPFHGYGKILATPEFLATKVAGTDHGTGATATLYTKTNFGLTASYEQVWSELLRTSFDFGANQLSFQQPTTGGALDNATITTFSFGADGIYKVSPKAEIGAHLGVAQRPYLEAISTSLVKFDIVSVPTMNIFGSYDLYASQPFTLGVAAEVGADFPTSASGYNTNFNPYEVGTIYVKHDVKSTFQTELGLRYAQWAENTSIVDQSQTDYGIYLKLIFPLSQP